MATFSASPAPKRTTKRHITPRQAGSSPPVTTRRTRLASSKPTSRLGTPAHGIAAQDRLSHINDGSSVASGMDIDDSSSVAHASSKSETLFAKSNELSVAFYANLPVEVKQVLKNAGEWEMYIFAGGC
jgi:nuclear pore complex protein Nup133